MSKLFPGSTLTPMNPLRVLVFWVMSNYIDERMSNWIDGLISDWMERSENSANERIIRAAGARDCRTLIWWWWVICWWWVNVVIPSDEAREFYLLAGEHFDVENSLLSDSIAFGDVGILNLCHSTFIKETDHHYPTDCVQKVSEKELTRRWLLKLCFSCVMIR